MPFGVLLLLFFCSGACGLIYQVLWLRMLSLVFGVTVYAASTVLAAFMAGLALGSGFAGRVVARSGRPLLVFGIAEMLIGVSALITPLAFEAASALYERLYQLGTGSLPVLTVARLATGFLVLLVPTFLMGLTLPVLSASSVVRGSRFGARVSALYAVNTAGAVVGAVLAGFVLIGAIGIARSFLLGAAINVAIGIMAVIADRRSRPDTTAVPEPLNELSQPIAPSGRKPMIGVVVLVSGLVALALEILWFRMLVQYLTATTYAFTTMLATVLAGIAIGGAIAVRWLRRPRDWVPRLFVIQIATALAVLVSAIFLGWSYRRGWRTSGELQASVAAILPAAILMGLGFPIAIRIAASPGIGDTVASIAGRVGRLYSLNVLGAIGGALLGGFVLLPLLGTRRGLIALAASLGASAAVLVVGHQKWARLLMVLGGSAIAFVALARQVRIHSLRRTHVAMGRTCGSTGAKRVFKPPSASTPASFVARSIWMVCIRPTIHPRWSACIV